VALGLGGCGARSASREDEVVVLSLNRPEHLDPRFPEDALGAALGRLVYPGLLDSDPQSFRARPGLARAVSAREGLRVRVTLDASARFVDGRPVRAADVVATYQSLLAPGSRSRLHATYARVFRGVSALDDGTVAFDLHRPDGTLESMLQQPILPADAPATELLATPDAAARFVGAGRLRVRSLDEGDWRLERVEGDGVPADAPRRYRFVSLRDPNTLALRLLHGEGDVAELKPEQIPVFAAHPDFAVRAARGVGLTYLGLHCGRASLQDVRVRQALAMALDRPGLRRARLGDHAVDAQGVLPPTHWAFAEGLPAVPFDPQGARRVLLQARGAEAVPLRLVLRVSTQRFALVTAQAIAAMLAAVGVEVEVRPSELATLLADLRAGRFDLTLLTVPDLSDPWGLSFWFASSSIPEGGRTGGNRWRFRDAALDAHLAAGAEAEGPEARRPHYVAAQRVLATALPIIPLWHPDAVYAVRRRWRSDPPRGDGRLDFC
jgi:ABC-type transport system substrate-binding protein